MNKGLNIFLVVLLCVVVYIGLLLSFYSSKNVEASNPYLGDVKSTRGTYGTYAVSANSMGSNMATISVRSANSMFRHRPVFSYAPASAPAYRQSPIANRQGLYTTSSAEFRSFGGGGNAGGTSMSGGAVSASLSSAVSGTAVSGIAMSSTSALAYNDNRRATSSIGVGMQSFSGEIALASTSTYAGIGNTTAGPMGVQGRKNVPGISNNYEGWLTSDFWDYGDGSHDLTMQDLKDLYAAMTGDTDFSNTQEWEAFLAWFESNQSNEEFGWYWAPISDAVPVVLLLCLAYAFVIYRKTRQVKKANAEN